MLLIFEIVCIVFPSIILNKYICRSHLDEFIIHNRYKSKWSKVTFCLHCWHYCIKSVKVSFKYKASNFNSIHADLHVLETNYMQSFSQHSMYWIILRYLLLNIFVRWKQITKYVYGTVCASYYETFEKKDHIQCKVISL